MASAISRLSSAQRRASAYSPRTRWICASVPAAAALRQHGDAAEEVAESGERLVVAELLRERPGTLARPPGLGEVGQPEQHGQPAEAERGHEDATTAALLLGMAGQLRLGKLPGLVVEVGGGAVSGQLLRICSRAQQRLDGLDPVIAAREVMGDQRPRLGALLPRADLEQQPDTLVQL